MASNRPSRPRSVTFDLPPSPRCVVQRRTVTIRIEDAFALYLHLKTVFDHLYQELSDVRRDQGRP